MVPFAEKIIERSQKKCWLRRERRVHDVSVDEEVGVEEDGSLHPWMIRIRFL